MKVLKRTRYFTAHSWNRSQAPAYNLKVYNVVDSDLQDKVFQCMETEEFYAAINTLISDFNFDRGYAWQAGFNGRSGGYLVLYRGGIKGSRVFTQPGLNIETADVPAEVLRAFRRLAVNIVKTAENFAKDFTVVPEEYAVIQTRKVLKRV